MVSIEIGTVTTNSFEVRVVGLPTGYAKFLRWYLDGSEEYVTGVATDESESEWEEFTNLSSNTSYILKIEIEDLNGNKVDEIEEEITTNAEEGDSYIPDVESIYIQERDTDDPATKIAVRARGFDEKYPYDWKIYWYVYENNFQIQNDSDTVYAGDDRSDTITFSGLTPETKYKISLRVRYEIDNSYKYHYAEDIYITTESESSSSNRPDYFEWDSPKVKGQPFNITAEEWGNLLDNINAVREYKGYSAISSTSNADAIARFYYPSKGDNFLASMYNQCIYAFEDMELLDYSSYRVLKGDPITADAINFLVETINSIE